MKAAVRVAPGKIEIVDRPAPSPGPGDTLIRVEAVALCGGDLHYFRGPMPFASAIPTGYVDAPRIVCHEAVGAVVEAPQGTGLSVGDRVTFDPQERCGRCSACRAGEIELCPHRRDMGYSADGAAAELVVIPTDRVYRVPDGVPTTAAAATHGLAAVLHALSAVDLSRARTALVAGPGPAGLMFSMAVRTFLGGGVHLLGRPSPRLDLAAALGIEPIALENDVWDRLRFEWGGEGGFDLVIDTTGAADVIESLLWCVRPKGSLLLYAPTLFSLDGNVVFRRELRLVGSTGATDGMGPALELIADGSVPLDRIITHTFELAQIQEAFELALAEPGRRRDLLKAVVRVG